MTFIFCKRPYSFGEEGKMVCECVLAKFQRLNIKPFKAYWLRDAPTV